MDPLKSNMTVHEPELPGVRTYAKDIASEKGKFNFGGIKLTVPEKATGEKSNPPGDKGRQGGGKELFDVAGAYNEDLVQAGTFVTDHKRKRLGTGELLKSAFTEWWGTTQKSMESTVDKLEFLKPKEEQRVEAPLSRTNIIQAAAQHARQAPRDDHAQVIEKVRTFAHDAEVVTGKPFTIKEPATKIGAHWAKADVTEKEKTATLDTKPLQTIDLRNSAVAPTVMKQGSTPLATYAPKITPLVPKVGAPTPVQVATPKILPLRTPEKKQGSVPVKPHKEEGWTHFAKTENAPIDLREKVATVTRPSIPTPRVETPRVPRPIHIETPPPPDVPKVLERQPVAISPVAFEHERTAMPTSYVPITESRPLSTIVHKRSESPSFFTVFTHIPRSLIITTIILVGGGLGVLTAVLVVQNAKNAPPEVSEAPIVAPSFLNVDEQIAFPLETDRIKFYTTLIELGAKNPALVSQFYPTVSEGGRTIPAESARIMEALSWNAPGSFVRGLGTHTMFGSVGEPFVILQSTNFDVAFAGMLSWERTMSTDLAPLFGEPLVTMAFTDALTSNRSIRILKDASGKEHIVYGFVNKNLIVVTTSTEALSKVISRIKSK